MGLSPCPRGILAARRITSSVAQRRRSRSLGCKSQGSKSKQKRPKSPIGGGSPRVAGLASGPDGPTFNSRVREGPVYVLRKNQSPGRATWLRASVVITLRVMKHSCARVSARLSSSKARSPHHLRQRRSRRFALFLWPRAFTPGNQIASNIHQPHSMRLTPPA
jgi:hypothetical protein